MWTPTLLATALLAAPAAAPEAVVGKKLPDFALPDFEGRDYDLASLRGRVTVFIFIATRCPVSNAYNARMGALAAEYAQRGVQFVGINSNKNEPVEEMREHATAHNLNFLILKDNENKVADLWGATRTPEVFLADANGILRYHGRIDNSQDESKVASKDLAAALDALLAGQPVPNPETRFFGCTIKRVSGK
jgi:peroxiredoxin